MEGRQRLIDAMPDGAGPRLHALEAAHWEESPEYQKLVGLCYDRPVCWPKPLPKEAPEIFAIVGKSIAYRVMNGPNEFTITSPIKDWDRRADLAPGRSPGR